MDVQIPLYRAKRLNSDEYIIGYLYKSAIYESFRIITVLSGEHSIDPSTLAIHFPDMVDSEGNKIFASLSEDGKGGDKLKIVALTNDHCQKGTISELTAFVQMGRVCVGAGVPIYPLNLTHSFQTIGIQQ